ncbi:MAG: hypothetical protein ACTS73_06075 [Arsenophonus sp. NEOnobi-MAG3]
MYDLDLLANTLESQLDRLGCAHHGQRTFSGLLLMGNWPVCIIPALSIWKRPLPNWHVETRRCGPCWPLRAC